MNPSEDVSDDDISINKKNRHQYYETAIADASEAEREIRAAEARGRQRMLREEENRRNLLRIAKQVGLVAVVAVIALVIWLVRR